MNRNKPIIDANALSNDTNDNSSSDDNNVSDDYMNDMINRDNYVEMTDMQYNEMAKANTPPRTGYAGKLLEKMDTLRSSVKKFACPMKNTGSSI